MSTYQFGLLSLRFLCLLVSYRPLALCRPGEVVRLATAKSCCYGGLRHSIKLYSPRMPTDWNCRGQTDPAIQAAVKADVPIKLK